jgi:hypothetical protein
MSPEARERSFDELAIGLSSGTLSRGKALRLMGAALVGSTLGLLGMGGIAAADEECKRNGKKCKKNRQCCSGICTSSGTCQSCNPGSSCGPGGIGTCFANASGTGTTCSCAGTCVTSCDSCSASEVCIVAAGGACGEFLTLACATPC